MNPLVSVIVPCYNQAVYLPNALQSVINQTYQNWECIIINDGSTDNTQEVADTYLKLDTRIRLIYQKNGGLSKARNTGLAKANGDFIQFLDADDVILPEKLEVQLTGLLEQDGDISICDYKKINFVDQKENKGQYGAPFLSEDVLNKLIEEWEVSLSIPCHCVLFKSCLTHQLAIRFNEDLPNHEDWVFWVEIFNQRPKLLQVQKVLCYYYYYDSSMSANRKWMGNGFIKAIDYLINYFTIQKDNNSTYIIAILRLKRQQILLKYSKYNQGLLHMINKKIKRVRKIFKG